MLPQKCPQCGSNDLSDGEVHTTEDQGMGFRKTDPGANVFSTEDRVSAVACEKCGYVYLYKTPQHPDPTPSILKYRSKERSKTQEHPQPPGLPQSQEAPPTPQQAPQADMPSYEELDIPDFN